MKSKTFQLLCTIFATMIAAVPAFAKRVPRLYITAGGGGSSSNSLHSVSGTIGQWDAGMVSGGGYTLTGGFWGPEESPAVEPGPSLSIAGGPDNTLILSWPRSYTGYVLQQSADLGGAGGGWTDIPQAPSINGENNEVTLPITGGGRLFRLHAP